MMPMAISGDYASPVTVNGFSCRNCSDVARAERNVDPANPSAGPFGVNDPKAAEKNHFSPDARNKDLLEELHRKTVTAASSAAAAAYGAAQSATMPGQFVNLTG